MYNLLIAWLPAPRKNVLWKLELSLNVKIFVWYLRKGVLTKDNLACRQWKGSLKCCFCNLGKPSNTFSWIAKWLDLCGGLYKFLLI
jgi:hypothetical protein